MSETMQENTYVCATCKQPFGLLDIKKTEPSALKGRTVLYCPHGDHKAALVKNEELEIESSVAETGNGKAKKTRKKKGEDVTPQSVTPTEPVPNSNIPDVTVNVQPIVPAVIPDPLVDIPAPPVQVPVVSKPAELPVVSSGKYSMSEFQEGLEGVTNVALPQIKIIHQGGMFELPNGSGPVQSFDAILLLARGGLRRLFLSAYDPNNASAPDCSSADGKIATRRAEVFQVKSGNPQASQQVNVFGECRTCYFNNWGTGVGMNGASTKGKRCNEYTVLFLLLEGSMMPVVLQIPPTGLKAMAESLATSIVKNVPPSKAFWRFTARRSPNGIVTEVIGNIARELTADEQVLRSGIFQSAHPYLQGYIDRFVTGGSGEPAEVVAVQ